MQPPEQFGNSDKLRAIGVLVVKPWWSHRCIAINEREDLAAEIIDAAESWRGV